MSTKKKEAYGKSGHATWDRHVNYVGRGNVVANGFASAFIRPWEETACNGREFPEGQLFNSDVKPFENCFGLPQVIRQAILDCKRPVVLACAHHPQKGGKIVHGWILSETGDGNHKLIRSWITGPTDKSRSVIEWIIRKITKNKS